MHKSSSVPLVGRSVLFTASGGPAHQFREVLEDGAFFAVAWFALSDAFALMDRLSCAPLVNGIVLSAAPGGSQVPIFPPHSLIPSGIIAGWFAVSHVNARVAELVDALDLGSSGVTRESSSLSFRTRGLAGK